MDKINYQKELEKIISNFPKDQTTKPTLLLHACCGPCSSRVIELLSNTFDITIYYYNPNIHPEAEYNRRLEELKKFLTQFPDALKNKVKLVVDDYNPEEYFSATNVRNEPELQTEPEKGERCRRCYKLRMTRSWNFALKNNFDWFTTTLSISPHKDSQMINQIGLQLEKLTYGSLKFIEAAARQCPGKFDEVLNQTEKNDVNQNGAPLNGTQTRTHFLLSDFKKNGGFLRSTQLSEQYGLWRQDYCGCVYSKQNMNHTEEKSSQEK